jgi:hypothetical protein
MLDSPASRDQIDDGNNQCDHKQDMDQAAGHVESPAQKPKDNEDCKNCPKHRYPFKLGTTKGEKRHLRAELSLVYGFWKARLTTTPHAGSSSLPLDAQLAAGNADEKIFCPNLKFTFKSRWV